MGKRRINTSICADKGCIGKTVARAEDPLIMDMRRPTFLNNIVIYM